jgi:hypothetical protein
VNWKRIIRETNPWLLAYSGAVFAFAAFCIVLVIWLAVHLT